MLSNEKSKLEPVKQGVNFESNEGGFLFGLGALVSQKRNDTKEYSNKNGYFGIKHQSNSDMVTNKVSYGSNHWLNVSHNVKTSKDTSLKVGCGINKVGGDLKNFNTSFKTNLTPNTFLTGHGSHTSHNKFSVTRTDIGGSLNHGDDYGTIGFNVNHHRDVMGEYENSGTDFSFGITKHF